MTERFAFRLNRLPRELPLSSCGMLRRLVAGGIRRVADLVDVETPIVFDRSQIISIDAAALSFDPAEARGSIGELAIAPHRDGGLFIVECQPVGGRLDRTSPRPGRATESAAPD